MRLTLLYILSFLAAIPGVQAQRETDYWYFGQAAGIRFTQLPPQSLSDGILLTDEGCTAISNSQGQLLFYSSGTAIYNRAHQTMMNGSGLAGDPSSTQGVLIAAQPGNDSIYFVFTNGAVHQLLENGLKYSIVNIRGDQGMGVVTSKNQGLLTDTYERIAAIRHCNNRDVWIVVRRWDSDQYYAYLLTASGLNTNPVISSTGFLVGTDINNNIGALKFSADGRTLACALGYSLDKVELMDFDRQTGRISNTRILQANPSTPAQGFPGTYGLEFSADGQWLYANIFQSVFESNLYQFNLSNSNPSAIESSRRLVHTESSGSGAGSLQLGRDGQIYVAYRGKSFLSVIQDPSQPAPACRFAADAISLDAGAGRRVNAGLPNFIQSYFDAASLAPDFFRTGSCINRQVQFQSINTSLADSVRWDFGDGAASTQLNPVHTFSSTGYQDVMLTVYKNTCAAGQQQIRKRIWIAETDRLLQDSAAFCTPGQIWLQAASFESVQYQWNDGSINDSLLVTSPGWYWVELEQAGCRLRDSTLVSLILPPVIRLGPDTSVCAQSPIQLDAGNHPGRYLWNTGDTSRQIEVNKPGNYQVTVTVTDGCQGTDSVRVISGDCPLWMPNAFTPNGDGLNDLFGPVEPIRAGFYDLTIYNRYGQVVFQTSMPDNKWDGSFQGKPQPQGVYLWVLRYQQKTFLPQVQKGTVLIFR